MADATVTQKLNLLLAAQDRAEERHGEVMGKLSDIEGVQRQQVEAVLSLSGQLATLREAVDRLADAANKEKPQKGQDLGTAMRNLLGEMEKQTALMDRIAAGVDRLPSIMETTASAAAEMAAGGVAVARPNA